MPLHATKRLSVRDRVVELVRVPARDLVPSDHNWRLHPESQRAALRGVLKEIGFAGALLARRDKDGKLRLIDGHLRAGIAPDMSLPVLVLDLDEKEADKLLLTYDPLSAMAQSDKDALMALLQSTSFEDAAVNAMLEALANDERVPMPDLSQGGLTDPDEVPSTADDLYVKQGDIWQCGEHRVMCGDSPTDYRKLLGDIPVDLTLTDPPYGISIVKGLGSIGGAKPFGRVRQPGGRARGVLQGRVGGPGVVKPRLYRSVTGDDKPFDPTWLLSVGKRQIIFGGSYFASKLRDGTAWLCWTKGVSAESSFSGFELAWTSTAGHMRLYDYTWSGMVRAGIRREELQDRIHPTQKPVGLLRMILQDFSTEKEAVFDPYLGSGSTLIACETSGRICYGIEIDPHYVQMAIERWQNFTGRKAVKVA